MLRNSLFKPFFVGEQDWGFEIIDGPFKEVCIQIMDIKIEENEAGNCHLDYHTVRLPEHLKEEDLKTPEFQAVIESILNDILKEAITEHENRDSHSKKPSE